MGLETATFISGLNVNNPVGATDPKSQGDDHLRLIKSTLLNTFPNISGAMNASHTELNNLVGVTGKTGSGNIVLSNAPTFTGLISGLAGSGAALSSLNASNISSGTLADARLSANVPLKSAANTFTATQTIEGTSAVLILRDTDANADEGRYDIRATAGTLDIFTRNDDGSAGTVLFRHTRTGSNSDAIALSANSITANGSEIVTTAGEGLEKIGNSLAVKEVNTDKLITDFVTDAGTSFTPGNGDAESIRRFTSASAITVNLNTGIPTGWTIGDSIGIIRGGTGTLTFAGTGTIRSPGGTSIIVQHGKAVATLVASGIWELSGNV